MLEDGKIVADSGPQVITRTLEDTNTENNDMGKNSAQLLVQGEPDLPCNSDPSVVRSVSRMRTTMKSASKEVNHYHDEERREITNPAELERGIKSPETLLEPIENEFPSEVKGELKFFSSKSKGVVCKEKVNEVSRLDDNGNLRTVTTHTRHEEETEDSELPDQNVPSKLPDLTPDLTQCQRFVGDVVLLPITQEPCIKNSSPSPKSWSTSNGKFLFFIFEPPFMLQRINNCFLSSKQKQKLHQQVLQSHGANLALGPLKGKQVKVVTRN